MTKEQRQEMIVRLGILGEKGLAVRKNSRTVYYSDRWNGLGILYWFTKENNVKQEWLDLVGAFEMTYDAKVYHITHEYTEFGELLDLLYISNKKERWEYDRQELREGYPLAYVINLSTGEKTFGTIGIKVSGGGLIRSE